MGRLISALLYYKSMSQASLPKSEAETGYSSNELDIFDEKIEQMRHSSMRSLTIIYSLLVGLLSALVFKKHTSSWRKLSALLSVATYLSSRTILRPHQ